MQNLENVHKQFNTTFVQKVPTIHLPETIVKITNTCVGIPYKHGSSKPNHLAIDSLVNQVIEQANYTNLYLQTVSSQLTHIEKAIQPLSKKLSPSSSKTHLKDPLESVFFKSLLDISGLRRTYDDK